MLLERCLSPTVACTCLLLVAVSCVLVVIFAMRGTDEGDPRYSHNHVTAVTACGLVRG